MRAAENAGLSASKVRRGLCDAEAINLPAVLLLRDRQAVVVLAPIKSGKVDIATTDNLDGIVTVPVADLEGQYSGTMLVVRAEDPARCALLRHDGGPRGATGSGAR